GVLHTRLCGFASRTAAPSFFLRIRPPPTPPLSPTRRSSDLHRETSPGHDERSGRRDIESALSVAAGSATVDQIFGVNHDRLGGLDRKSTRLNSSHLVISYAVFCLKKKKKTKQLNTIQQLSTT